MLALLVRDTPRETVVGLGTKRARLIPAGTRVIAAPLAAMFDPEIFPRPSHFCASREFDCYIHFGQGPRHCFGRYVAETALMEIIRSLLLVPDLARADSNGRLAYEGPAAFSMVLTFRKYCNCYGGVNSYAGLYHHHHLDKGPVRRELPPISPRPRGAGLHFLLACSANHSSDST